MQLISNLLFKANLQLKSASVKIRILLCICWGRGVNKSEGFLVSQERRMRQMLIGPERGLVSELKRETAWEGGV